MFCEAKLFYSFLRNFWAGREAQFANLIGSSHTRTQFTFFETRMTVGRSIYLRRNIMAFQIVSGRDATESLFNEKFPNFFDILKRFWHCLFRIFEFSWSSKNFCNSFNFKTSHQVILSEKNVRGKLSGFVALNYTRSSPLKREDATWIQEIRRNLFANVSLT